MFLNELVEISNNIFKEKWDCEILQINGEEDHLHILFEAPPQIDFVTYHPALSAIEMIMFNKNAREEVLKRILSNILKKGIYDFIIIDTNPTLSMLNFNIVNVSNYCIPPLQLGAFGLEGLDILLNFIKGVIRFNPNFKEVKLVINNYDVRKEITKTTEQWLRENYGDMLFKTIIRVDTNIEKAQLEGQPVLHFDTKSRISFATIGNNVGTIPIMLNGKGLKSINQYYNKQISYYREIAKRMNNLDYTKRMNKLTIKRNNKIEDFIHKASKWIIDYTLALGVNTIIIGNNKDWKRKSKMSKKVNQSFVGIPHQEFINKIIYKVENVGIKVILTEESYTSGTSFLDGELPIKENYNKSRRIFRGLFRSNKGKLINADLNGAYQIMKKVFPNAFAEGIEGVGLHPVRVNIA